MRRSQFSLAMLFILPALFFYVVFLIVPLIGGILISFTDWEGYTFRNVSFIGLGNYARLLQDNVFWDALKHNVIFVIGTVVVQCTIGLIVALILDQEPRLAKFFRGVYFMPAVISLVVVGIVFSLILSPSFGIFNPILELIGLGRLVRDWLGSPSTALPTLMAIQVWLGFGFSMFIFVARLQSLPVELYEAAKVDGAGDLRRVWHITLPQLKETGAVVAIMAVINALKIFTLPYVMTRGGPNHATEVLGTWAYFQGFTSVKAGYGSAIATILILFTFVLTALQFKYTGMGRFERDV